MEPFHRALGIAAAIGDGLSRFSINFVQLNWVVMGVLAVALTGAANEARYAAVNDATPRAVSVAEVLAHRDLDRNYVAVRGSLLPRAVYQETSTRRGATTVKATYQPLIDREAQRVLLVKRTGAAVDRSGAQETTVTGMIVPCDRDLQSELRGDGSQIDGMLVDVDYVLEVGRAPGNLAFLSVATVVAAIALFALLVSWQRRYVIFRPAAVGTPAVSDEAIGLRASGRYTLDGQKQRRFLGMPAAVAWSADGAPVVTSNIDASSRFMGFKTSDGAGTWIIALPVDAAATCEWGWQYLGWRRWPALRLRHGDVRGRPTVTVLACASERQQAGLMAILLAGAPATDSSPAPAN